MSNEHTEPSYFELEIIAETPSTDIWLGDDAGSLVVKETGHLKEPLLPGNYVVEFGLGTPCYPVPLFKDSTFTQAELALSGPCERPVFQLTDDDHEDIQRRSTENPDIRALLDRLLSGRS